ncbi:YrhB domain-containing protein [Streptomyces sp. NPDC021093]|uniref:YrhB domain-containing protein n=1 Tax=Streptomyces sp. NPDC021093 TaxID=3365112 RepID=UPI0037AF1A8E
MIGKEQARELADQFLKSPQRHWEMPMTLMDGEPHLREGVLYFACQSVDYIRTGDWRDMAVGSGPVVVHLETGECRIIGSLEAARLEL